MPLFTRDDHARVARGELTVTYRLWKKPHVTAGKTYAAGFGGAYRIDSVDVVRAGDITDREARAAGCADAAALLALCGAHTKATVRAGTKLHRVRFTFLADAPERPTLPVDEVLPRLARLDRAAPGGKWTQATLELIANEPRVVARELAARLGRPTQPFKVDVRKLKRLGLTISHEVGYELSELGQEVLDRLRG